MELTLQELLDRIAQADTTELEKIIHALFLRHSQLHSDWEFAVIALPKNSPMERRQILKRILEYEAMREGQCPSPTDKK